MCNTKALTESIKSLKLKWPGNLKIDEVFFGESCALCPLSTILHTMVKKWELFVRLQTRQGTSADHQKNLLWAPCISRTKWTNELYLKNLNCQKLPAVNFYSRNRGMFRGKWLHWHYGSKIRVSCEPGYLRRITKVAWHFVLECHLKGQKDLPGKMPEVLKIV